MINHFKSEIASWSLGLVYLTYYILSCSWYIYTVYSFSFDITLKMGYTSMGQIEQELYGDLENDAELEAELLALQGEEGGGGSQSGPAPRRKHSEYIVKDLYNCFRDNSVNFLLLP